jgi:hypothetical protein
VVLKELNSRPTALARRFEDDEADDAREVAARPESVEY